MIQFEINYLYYWLTMILGIQHHSETREFCTDKCLGEGTLQKHLAVSTAHPYKNRLLNLRNCI